MEKYTLLSTIAKTATSKVVLVSDGHKQYAMKQISVPKQSDDEYEDIVDVVVTDSDDDDDSIVYEDQHPVLLEKVNLLPLAEKTSSWKKELSKKKKKPSSGIGLGISITSTPVAIDSGDSPTPSKVEKVHAMLNREGMAESVDSEDDSEGAESDDEDDDNKVIIKTENIQVSLDITHNRSASFSKIVHHNEQKVLSGGEVIEPSKEDEPVILLKEATPPRLEKKSGSKSAIPVPQFQIAMKEVIQKRKKQEFKYIQNEIQALKLLSKGPHNIYGYPSEKKQGWPYGDQAPKKVHDEENISSYSKHICLMKEVIEDVKENRLCLVLEYADGGDLFSIIEYYDTTATTGHMREEQARFYFKQIVCGLLYMHRSGISHRDLKPENILVMKLDKSHPILKLTDFGFCGILKKQSHSDLSVSSNTLFDDVVGTESWCAPEILNRQRYDGRKADIWSLGCILYALLTGCFAFDHDDIQELHKMIDRVEIQFPSFISQETRQFLLEMICKDIEKRLTIEEVYEHSWMKKGAYL